jgi:hypothetical protein
VELFLLVGGRRDGGLNCCYSSFNIFDSVGVGIFSSVAA